MKKRILVSRILIAIFVALVIASFISLPAYAVIVYLEEGSSQWAGYGNLWDFSYTGGNGYSSGRWRVYSWEPATTYWWWVWIPSNGGSYDAVVNYTVYSGSSDSLTKTVNQQSYANQWVYMDRGLNGNSGGNIFMDNSCVPGWGCSWNYQVWWDDVMYQHP